MANLIINKALIYRLNIFYAKSVDYYNVWIIILIIPSPKAGEQSEDEVL